MARVISWGPDEWKRKMEMLLSEARGYRASFETTWASNVRQYVGNMGFRNAGSANITFESLAQLAGGTVDAGDSAIGVNYIFKYTRFLQSQLSATPPSVIIRPTTPDPGDHQNAEAADRGAR